MPCPNPSAHAVSRQPIRDPYIQGMRTTTYADKQKYVTRDYGFLVGKTIKAVRPLTEGECEDIGWEFAHEDYAVVVEFTDGTGFVPLADPEGNGAGFLEQATLEPVK